MSPKNKARKIDHEWENRVLCSDESCIGTIGPDGRCRECGLRYEGKLPEAIGDQSEDSDHEYYEDAVDAGWDDDPDGEEGEGESASDSGDEWAKRTLCIDEACIGVVGKDGRCKECGKSHSK